MAWLEKVDQSAFIKEIDSYLLRPLSDDVRTRMLALEGVEVTSKQFAELHVLVTDCARILHLEKVPRVFLAERTQFPGVTENYSEPVVILQSSILDCFKEPAELRFIIGRELGHVKAGHTRWHTLVRRTKTIADKLSFLGDTTVCLPLLPLFLAGFFIITYRTVEVARYIGLSIVVSGLFTLGISFIFEIYRKVIKYHQLCLKNHPVLSSG